VGGTAGGVDLAARAVQLAGVPFNEIASVDEVWAAVQDALGLLASEAEDACR
jgi:hypothetical protein